QGGRLGALPQAFLLLPHLYPELCLGRKPLRALRVSVVNSSLYPPTLRVLISKGRKVTRTAPVSNSRRRPFSSSMLVSSTHLTALPNSIRAWVPQREAS